MDRQRDGYRVVVVDDDVELLGLMRSLLPTEGNFEVITHDVLHEAAALVARERPDLVIMDLVQNRQERGWELIEQLRGDTSTADIPILVCSAAVRSLEERRAALEASGIAVVTKPFELDEFLDRVWQALKSDSRS
jgi:DNA-binding response OmpR family regulator